MKKTKQNKKKKKKTQLVATRLHKEQTQPESSPQNCLVKTAKTTVDSRYLDFAYLE